MKLAARALSPPKVRILVIDDHRLVRDGLKHLVTEQDDMEVVGEAGDGQEGVRMTQQLSPDVVLVDGSMPGWSGIKVTEVLAQTCPDVKVVAVTRHHDSPFVRAMFDAGARGYVLKQTVSVDLAPAVRAVIAGQRFISSSIGWQDSGVVQTPCGTVVDEPAPITSVEEQVLRLLAACYSNREIAERLAMTIVGVADVKAGAMQKIRLATRVQLIAYARVKGWFEASR
jgi:two-component system response regulator NreC